MFWCRLLVWTSIVLTFEITTRIPWTMTMIECLNHILNNLIVKGGSVKSWPRGFLQGSFRRRETTRKPKERLIIGLSCSLLSLISWKVLNDDYSVQVALRYWHLSSLILLWDVGSFFWPRSFLQRVKIENAKLCVIIIIQFLCKSSKSTYPRSGLIWGPFCNKIFHPRHIHHCCCEGW